MVVGQARFNTTPGTFIPTISFGQNLFKAFRADYGDISFTPGLQFPLDPYGNLAPTVIASRTTYNPDAWRYVVTCTLSCFVAYGDTPPVPTNWANGEFAQTAPDKRYFYQLSSEGVMLPGVTTMLRLFDCGAPNYSGFSSGWNYTVNNVVMSYQVIIYPTPFA